MKKIPTLFRREFDDHKVVNICDEVSSELSWVLRGEGIATEKFDGSCCAIIDGKFYRRYDAKRNKRGALKQPPANAIPCGEPDPVTGHWPHWVPVSEDAGSKWYIYAKKNAEKSNMLLEDGTYEAIGPHFQSNPYNLSEDTLVRHGSVVIDLPDRSFEGIRTYLSKHNIEGIVFWKDGEPRCKIKRKDFGFKWPDDKKRVKYYVFEVEMPEEYKKLLNQIAEKEKISLDKLTASALEYMADHVEETMEWKAELEKLPEDKKMAIQQIRVLRTYPVYTGETDLEARERALLKEIQTSLKLPEMSQKEFLDHIDEEEFFLTFGNPVIINCENGQKLICTAWQMAERFMRMTGRGEEVDEVIRKAAEMQENE